MSAREFQIIEPVPILTSTLPEFIIQRRVLTPLQCERLAGGNLLRGRYYRSNSRSLTKRVDIAYVYPKQARWLFAKNWRRRRQKKCLGLGAVRDH